MKLFDLKKGLFNLERLSIEIINNKRIVSRGFLGLKDDIVVNSVENPRFIYGICNGFGGFKKNYFKGRVTILLRS